MCCKIITDNLISAINSLQMQSVYSCAGVKTKTAGVVKMLPSLSYLLQFSLHLVTRSRLQRQAHVLLLMD